MLPRIDSLSNLQLQTLSMSLRSGLPSDDRVVVLHDIVDKEGGKYLAVAARYRNNRWIGECTGEDLGDDFSPQALWSEALYCNEKTFATTWPD